MERETDPAPKAAAQTGRRRFLSPINARRWDLFCANRRGFWSLWIFLLLFLVTLFSEFIANDKPLLIHFDGAYYMPVLQSYAETEFGGEFLFPTWTVQKHGLQNRKMSSSAS